MRPTTATSSPCRKVSDGSKAAGAYDEPIERSLPGSPGANVTEPDGGARVRGFRPDAAYLAFGAIACLLILSRLSGLDQSLQHDEVVTVVNYVKPGPQGFWGGGYGANNHLLFSLASWLTTSATGLDEVALRAWAVLPGIVAVAVLTWWSWQRMGRWVAVLVAFLATTSPLFLELHKQARGYGLMALAAVLLLIAADRVLVSPHRSWRHWTALGAASVLGIGSHLAFAVGFLAQSATLATRRRLGMGVVLTTVCVGLISAALYAPLLDQMPSNLAQTAAEARAKGGPPLEWHAPLTGPATLLAPSVEVLGLGIRYRGCQAGCYSGIAFVLLIPALFCWVAGIVALWSQGRRELLLVLAAPAVLSFLVLTVQHEYVGARFVSYTLPSTLIVAAVGIVAVVRRLSAYRYARPVVWGGAGLIAALMLFQFGRLTLWWNARPFEDLRTVAALVDREGEGPILTNSSRPTGLFYYVRRDRVKVLSPTSIEVVTCSAPAPYTFVHHPFQSAPLDLSCLERRRARTIRVHQRDRGKFLDVYLVEG